MIERDIQRRGQTLIEALLALSMITISFMGIMSLLSKSFFYNRVVADQLKATYLASEGIELAKSFIDHDLFAQTGWGNCFNGGTDYEIDYTMNGCNDLLPITVPATPLRFDPATNKYSYQVTAGSTNSNFSRDVRVTVSGDEIIVKSIVTWSTGPVTSQSINLEDHFYNWRK